ncbi:MAG TPA: hypothetical protein VEL74_08275 [Thermoanaerobaculia bacterium]|nr:hypothetical protein [Thermoanaerobaculia bacterium]
MSQLGPAWVSLTFACDCTFTSSTRLPWQRIHEQGIYSLEDGVIHFERRGGTTIWPFGIDGASLRLEEAPGEFHSYRRLAEQPCRPSAAISIPDPPLPSRLAAGTPHLS